PKKIWTGNLSLHGTESDVTQPSNNNDRESPIKRAKMSHNKYVKNKYKSDYYQVVPSLFVRASDLHSRESIYALQKNVPS
ncbi:hypothetical protein L9F63_014285, partial [Diploptera punctata]